MGDVSGRICSYVIFAFGYKLLLFFFFSKFSGRAWREKLEQAEIRKREETKELQVISFFGVTFILLVYSLYHSAPTMLVFKH